MIVCFFSGREPGQLVVWPMSSESLLLSPLLIFHISSRSVSFIVTRSKFRLDLFWVFCLRLPVSHFVRLSSLVDNYPKMFREQNNANASTRNILYFNISDVDISGLGRNSDSDMGTFWNCNVKRYETQTGDRNTPLPCPKRVSIVDDDFSTLCVHLVW